MQDLQRILAALRRLNDLEAGPVSPWVRALSPAEREIAAESARRGIPTAILGHHGRMIARGKCSLASVIGRVCGACGERLPASHQRPEARGRDLDVCDHCGVFLEWAKPRVRRAKRAA